MAGRVGCCMVRFVWARHGAVRSGRHGQVCHGALWLGAVGRVRDKNSFGVAGKVRRGEERLGKVRHGRHGKLG